MGAALEQQKPIVLHVPARIAPTPAAPLPVVLVNGQPVLQNREVRDASINR